VGFACSLERNYKKKVRQDLVAAKSFGEPVDRLVFFHHLPIKTADRHKLKKEAIEKCGVELEIFDGPAIAEMLADSQTAWIAQRYLSLSSEFVLPQETPPPGWFEAVLLRAYSRECLTSANFFELKDAIRFATWRSERHSDLDKLLRGIQTFRQHPFPGIRRKAIYETFVASLRGLETTAGLESSVREYFADVDSLNDPAEIEDGAVLVGYALGARARGVLDMPLAELSDWHMRLTTRIQTLKNESATVGRQCSCLFTEGYLAFNRCMTAEHTTDEGRIKELRRSAEASIQIWHELAKKAKNAPMFPIERLARLVNELMVQFEGVAGIDTLIRDVDALSAERSGQEKVAEHHRIRASLYVEGKQYLRALEELHRAHSSAFLSGTTLHAATVCLQVSQVYAEMQLFFAAKYYGLAAAYASLTLPDERLRQFAYAGCAEAACADYTSGGSLLYFLSARMFRMLTFEYSMGGDEDQKTSEWARINFYALLLARGAGLVFEKLQRLIVEQILPFLDLDEIYAESRPMLDEFFSQIGNSDDLTAKAIGEGIAPAFSDVGGKRTVAWRQLATNWHLEWDTEYETERQAEALAAYLQILLADFSRIDLAIIPGDVFVNIALHSGKLAIRDVADNDRVSRVVLLPRVSTGPDDTLPSSAEVVALVLLREVSALSEGEFREHCETRFEGGLRNRLTVYRPSESLFEEFYERETYSQLYNVARSSFVRPRDHVVETWKGLEGPQGTHPKYDRAQSHVLVRNRYKNAVPMIRRTRPRLIASDSFRQTLQELRGEGWKDWHLLLAIDNARFNYLLGVVPSLRQSFDTHDKEVLGKIRLKPEEATDPEAPVSHFNAENLRRSLSLSQLSTLKSLGFVVRQLTPNLKGIDLLLRRFHYWDDDVPHPDFFSSVSLCRALLNHSSFEANHYRPNGSVEAAPLIQLASFLVLSFQPSALSATHESAFA
jgi:hypothetical protein